MQRRAFLLIEKVMGPAHCVNFDRGFAQNKKNWDKKTSKKDSLKGIFWRHSGNRSMLEKNMPCCRFHQNPSFENPGMTFWIRGEKHSHQTKPGSDTELPSDSSKKKQNTHGLKLFTLFTNKLLGCLQR